MSDVQIYTWPEVAAVCKGATTPVVIHGRPALGKTFLATMLDEDCYSMTLTEESGAAEARGHYVPHGDRFVWQHGPAIRAWIEGRPLILNEISKASGDMLTFFLALLDDPRFARLTLPNSETVRPVHGFKAIATCNGSPDDLPEALQSRFAIRLAVHDVHPDAIAAIGQRYRATAEASCNGRSSFQSDVRQWRAFETLAGNVTEDLAARAVFGHNYQDVLTAVALANR